MKIFAPVFFFLALALLSEAVVEDSSIIDEFDKCTSELRVKIQGSAISATVTQARADCKANCAVGVATFKGVRCPALCGLTVTLQKAAGPTTCNLCVPDSNVWIKNCRDLMDIGLNNCQAGCDTAAPDSVGVNFRISSTSGAIRRTFPSRIDP